MKTEMRNNKREREGEAWVEDRERRTGLGGKKEKEKWMEGE